MLKESVAYILELDIIICAHGLHICECIVNILYLFLILLSLIYQHIF